MSKRLGVYNQQNSKPRPILLKMRYEDDATYCHSYGKGFKIRREKFEAWANPDLTQAEREAKFNERKARREEELKEKNKNQAASQETPVPEPEIPVPEPEIVVPEPEIVVPEPETPVSDP